MSLDQPYDEDNIFARIIAGDMSCVKILETDDTLAFMDVFPQSRGHCLVIHKHARATNIFDMDPAALGELVASVQKVAGGVKRALKPDGVRIAQFNGEAAGQSVFHLHFHIIPAYQNEPLGAHASGSGPADSETLKPLAEAIAAAL